MKKFALMALSLIIVMMCVSPVAVMGQSRRSANSASSSTSVQKSSSTRSTAANTAAAAGRRSGSSSNINAADKSSASRAAAPRTSATASSRPTNISHESAAHNTAKNTAVNNAARNVASNTASNAARHDNIVAKPGNDVTHKANKSIGNNSPMASNNPPRGNDGYRNEPPKVNNNPPRPVERHGNVPPAPRPPRGSHFRATMIGTLVTIAKINAINNAIRRAENAARLANRYSVTVNRSYVPRTYTDIVATVNDDINYYYSNGVFYVIGADGDYYVIEPPIGALVEAIPADNERLVIDGEIFYKVDDTLYRVTVVDGIPYFEVVLNL